MRSGKTLAMAYSLAKRLYEVPGATVIVHACGCKSRIDMASVMAAVATGPDGLTRAVEGALLQHRCPTTNNQILVEKT